MARIAIPKHLVTRPFTVAEGAESGLTPGRLRGPDLAAPFAGVRLVAGTVATLERRCLAYQLRMSASSFFCGVTAAALVGVPFDLELERLTVVHVATPHPGRARVARNVVGHRVRLMGDDVREWHGIRLSSPARLWCELGGVLSLTDLVAAGDYLIHHRLPHVRLAELEDAVARYPGRRGRATLAAALPLLDDHAESRRESILRVILVRAGFVGLVANVDVVVPGLRYPLHVDLAFPSHKVALEYQGDYHRDVGQWRKDLTRIAELEAAGWYVMQIGADDLEDASALVRRVMTALEAHPAH